MNAVMLAEIEKQHVIAQQTIKAAREAMRAATDQALVVAALCEKSQRHHRSSIMQFLAPVMNSTHGKAYLATARAAKNRPIHSDKRVLQLIGVMTKAPSRKAAFATRAKPSLTSHITKINVAVASSLDDRPVSKMSGSDREQLKAVMRPLAVLYVELDKGAAS